MITLDVADLVVIAGRVLGIGPAAARAICARRVIDSSTFALSSIIRSASSSMMMMM